MDKLRVLSIIPYKILPAKLGGEYGFSVFNEYLAKQVDLIGVTTKNNDPSLAKGYSLLNILSDNRSRYGNFSLVRKVAQIITSGNITHLITEHPYYAWLAHLLRKRTSVRWTVHSHNIEYMRSKSIGRSWWKALKWYESWAYKKADKVFFISEDDRQHAIEHLGVSAEKSMVVTYGIEIASIPADRKEMREKIKLKHNIADNEYILLFNGALYHSTNYDALKVILDEINPHLLANPQFKYKIIVCGKGLPDFFNELKDYAGKNVIYAGFVDDISMYFKSADIFLNPILSGGGVKTKAIEAIAMDCTVVSTPLGAMGINKEVCGNKLNVVQEGQWKEFGDLVIDRADSKDHTPDSFYEHYYWENIIRKVVTALAGLHA
jgi:glycosyltransferase involved in cell wall biosynthesis